MQGYKRHLIVAVALGGCLTALTGSALAAPPAAPPGQEKKAEQAATPAQPPATPPGQAKKAAPAPAAATPTKAKTHGVNATTAGTKPSNTTSKNTHTTVGARPDVSKRYGNGKTAAQIAAANGAPGTEPMYGPGNSQPHKVCGKNGHWVDVHAVKSYTGARCSTSSSTSSSVAPHTASVTPQTAAAANSSSSTSSAATAHSSAPAAGVLGAEHTSGAADAGGVAGAFATIGNVAAGTLPFTGFPLWAVVLLALAAIALGVTLWRHGRPATTRDVV
jgi:hypothetical protein